MPHCTVCHKPLNTYTGQMAVLPGKCEPQLVCFEDRECEPRQVKYNPIPRVQEIAKRYAFYGRLTGE